MSDIITLPDITVPSGAASTPAEVTAPAQDVPVPASSITVAAHMDSVAYNGKTMRARVPKRTYAVPASSVIAPEQVLSFNVLQEQTEPEHDSPLSITALSSAHALAGASLTIFGTGFGSSQGESAVHFGEPLNVLGFRPCTREAASYVSWSDTRVVVTVPSMSPGKAGALGTYHDVRVTVAGQESAPAAFYIDPMTIYSGQTFTTASAAGNNLAAQHDALYDGCTFTATNQAIPGNDYGVVSIGRDASVYAVTFLDCTLTSNTGAGSGDGVNGYKIVGNDHDTRDISIVGGRIGAMSRMGWELVKGSGTPRVRHLLRDLVIDPSGGEPISFSEPGAAYSLVDNVTMRGWGNLSSPPWGNGFECNTTTHVEVRDLRIYGGHGYGCAFNIAGPQDGSDCYLLFVDSGCDFGTVYQEHLPAGSPCVFGFTNYVRGSKWIGCSFDVGDATHHAYNAANDTDGWKNHTGNDWSESTITGYCGKNSGTPMTAAGYWTQAPPASNRLPVRV